MTPYLEGILSGGLTYDVKRTSEGALFHPVDGSETALEEFQSIVAEIENNSGNGYEIFKIHRTSELAGNFADRVLILFKPS